MAFDVPLLHFPGANRLALALIVLLAVAGVIGAVRGFWGTSRAARRLVVVCASLAIPIGVLCAIVEYLAGQRQLARLGPAVTQRDIALVHGAALSILLAGLTAAVVIAAVAGFGWVRGTAAADDPEPPPRRPQR